MAASRQMRALYAFALRDLYYKRTDMSVQDVQHQTEGAAVSSAPLLRRMGGSAAVCQAMGCTTMGSVALLLVYFASTSQKTIERIDFDGGSREVLVSDVLDSPEGLAIDWVHRKMYWTDKSRATVACSTLVGLNRQTIVSERLEKPRGIAVHPSEKKLFWTDTGAQPVVESASLEGKSRVVIASTDLVSPSGLTIDFTEDRLFWCDLRRGVVETAALDGSHRQVLLDNQVGRPFDLAVFEDRLWISDQEHQQLRSVHKRTGKNLQNIHGLLQPASIVVVHPLTRPESEASSPQLPTSTSADVSTENHSSDSESCPSTHDNYCLYEGVCFYFPEVDSYACNCVAGYIGERCQFSDLEWWDLQQAEEEKKKNVLIGACVVVLVSLLSIAACVTLCYRTKIIFGKHPPVDDVSESSVTDETMSVASSVPRKQVQRADHHHTLIGIILKYKKVTSPCLKTQMCPNPSEGLKAPRHRLPS
ncbi:Pro-epidermal growth factor [Takifugu flavidus]|uniref:Pro-epidermal growth factor n=1 Tax=Takifugu flavidus TaxID=433684 RepID=A0A5C6MJL1_9TELE|nr:Pro-epidermal growth factor [Takifugu flavidus]